MNFTKPSRTGRSVRRREAFESLEDRRLLSAGHPVVSMDWHGHRADAEAGQFILSLDRAAGLVDGRPGPAQVAAVERALDARKAGITVEKYLGRDGQFLLDAPLSMAYEQVLASVKSVSGFDFLEPNLVLRLENTPNDPLASYEYALNNTGTTPQGASKPDADMDAYEAWDVTTGSSDVVVGMVDTGVDYTHEDLAANMWHNPGEIAGDGIDNDRDGYVDDVYGINTVTGSGNPMDDNGHGTHTAGTVAAVGNNGVGVSGVSWNSKIMALKFLDANGSGATADAIECLNYAVSMRQRGVNIRLTNNSWAGGGFEQSLKNAITATANAGMLFVAAAGNGGSDGIGDNNDLVANYPSNYDVPNALAVAATDRFDQLAGFSNFGAATVDLAAPGVDIASTARGGGYAYMSGTSMATPQVSGVATLAWSLKPDATYAQVRDALLNGVDKLSNLTGKVATGGRANALGTLRQLSNSISGVAYNDADGGGTRGASEPALSGRTVFLDTNNNGTPDAGEPTRTTDAGGAYRFGALLPGTYTVRQVVPAGWATTAPAAAAYTVQVVDGHDLAGRDFGSRLIPANPPPAATATLGPVTPGGAYYWFQVTYADDVAVDWRTIGSTDVQVTGPGGYSQLGALANLTTANGSWTATYRVPAPGGLWDAADNGAYAVSMRQGEVADTAGAFVAAATLGQINVQVADVTPPTASLAAADVTAAGGTSYWFTVTYSDDTAVDWRTVGGTDVQVTGPGGYSQPGTLANLTTAGGKWSATYRVPAPGGAWDAADSGTYTVSMRAGEVADTAGKFVAPGTLGTFAVRLADLTPPTVALTAADVTTAGGNYYWFQIAYSDDAAIAWSTIDNNDVLVSGPGGYSAVGVLANLTVAGTTATATYRVAAPGGTWGAEDDGAYTVSMQPSQVADTSGNFVAAGTLGTFQVVLSGLATSSSF